MFGQQADRFKYLLLMCSLLMLLTVYPLLYQWNEAHRLFDVFFCLALAASVPAVGRRRGMLLIAVSLAVPAVVAIMVRALTDVPLPPTPGLVLRSALLIYTAAAILVDLFKSLRVTSDTICGAICVYLLLGLTWALLLNIVSLSFPGSFKGLDAEPKFYDFVYFSFVTLTTLGYGDIVPVTPPARMLCWLEALSGQLFVAVLIARFVGLHGLVVRSDHGPSQECIDRNTSAPEQPL